MSLLAISLLILGALFISHAVAAAESVKSVELMLEKDGTLWVGSVRDYDSDDIVTVDFVPKGAVAAVSALGRGHFLKKHFPPGAQMAVLYNPLCPAMNSIAPERTEEALASLEP